MNTNIIVQYLNNVNMSSQEKEGRIQLALYAYNTGQFRSLRAAATAYNAKYRTLTDRAKGITFRPETRPNRHNLTETEEQTIVRYILDLDSRGFAPRLCEVEDMANKILGSRTDTRVGKCWAQRFVTRTEELRMAYNRAKDRQRIKQEDPEVINAWFERVRSSVRWGRTCYLFSTAMRAT